MDNQRKGFGDSR